MDVEERRGVCVFKFSEAGVSSGSLGDSELTWLLHSGALKKEAQVAQQYRLTTDKDACVYYNYMQ